MVILDVRILFFINERFLVAFYFQSSPSSNPFLCYVMFKNHIYPKYPQVHTPCYKGVKFVQVALNPRRPRESASPWLL
jgi:hypothetical protein